MKRIIALLLTAVLIFSLSSCTQKPAATEQDNDVQEENVEEIIEEIPKTIDVNAGVFWCDFSDAFLSTVRDAMNNKLDTLGIKYTNYDAAKTQATQNDQIDSAIANDANLLIVNIVETAAADAAQAITDKAKEADIPVIFFNREIYDDVLNSYENACYVGTNAGKSQGIMIGQYLLENYETVDLNDDGHISYIMMKGTLGDPEAERRTSQVLDVCFKLLPEAGKQGLTYYMSGTGCDRYHPANWSRKEALNQMEIALFISTTDWPIEVVIANGDNMALGCIDALNNIGWNTGEENAPSIPVFGIDYTQDAQAAIEVEKMTGSILLDADSMAETIAYLVENVMNDKNVFEGAVDVFNVDEYCAKIRVPCEAKTKENN